MIVTNFTSGDCFVQILTGEDWNQVMYYAINSKGGRLVQIYFEKDTKMNLKIYYL